MSAIVLRNYGIEGYNNWVLDKMKQRLRSRTRSAFRRIKESKPTKTEELLGASWSVVKLYIESFFTDELNWSNFSQWHIDHIEPLCRANTKDELIKLCKYTNLQPLMAKDNLIKGGRF